MKYDNHEIANCIDSNRLPSANAVIAFRQMLALESIAENLTKLAYPGESEPEEILPGAVHYSDVEALKERDIKVSGEPVGPATQHRRGRRAPEAP